MVEYPDNFLFIIGSPKAGTTSLARWLDQRDDMVLGAQKEPRYFTDFAKKPWAGPGSDVFKTTLLRTEIEYQENFSYEKTGKFPVNGGWAIDASTDYLWCQAAAENIKAFSKSKPSKVICILRDPVDRALSEFHHTLRDRLEDHDLQHSLDHEQERMDKNWQPLFYHKRRSTCLADLARFHALFGKELLILGFHEFKEPEKLLAKVHDFLGLSGPVVKPSAAENPSTLPKNIFWQLLFANPLAISVGRALFKTSTRKRIKQTTHIPARDLKATGPRDEELLRRALADEIAACQANDLVNTKHWTTAVARSHNVARNGQKLDRK